MTNTAKTWTTIVVIVIIVAIGLWIAHANNNGMAGQSSYDKTEAGYQDVTASSSHPDYSSVASSTSADGDMMKIDAEMSGLSSDNASVDQGLQNK